jgi:uncharacterized protein YicC (UPF0701 family)
MEHWRKIQNALDLLWELRHKEGSDLELWIADQIEKRVQLLATTDPFIAQLYRTYEARWERDYAYA